MADELAKKEIAALAQLVDALTERDAAREALASTARWTLDG